MSTQVERDDGVSTQVDVEVAGTPDEADAPRRRRGLPRWVTPLLSGALGAVLGASAMVVVAGDARIGSSVVRVASPLAGPGSGRATGVAAVAAKVMPSVVRIDVAGNGRFGRSSGTGSGVIYRADGYIITNDHVVDGATTVRVTLASGEQLDARVVGNAMPSDDIAVIKVDRTNLPAATFGSSSDLSVGDTAVAIGSPFGLQGTVTAGVISALHRNIELGQDERFTDAIQTDAPINPGNSGGALATADGVVIGINTAIVGGGSGNVGVGFAIPMDIARRDADQIIATGHASRPLIGIAGESVPGGGGALIQGITAGGPAAQAGLRAGDVIVELGGTEVRSMDDLVSVLSRRSVGESVTVSFLRDGSRSTVDVRLAARD